MKYILHVFTDRDFVSINFLEVLNEACFRIRIPDCINFFRVKPSEFEEYKHTMLKDAKERNYDTLLFVDADSDFSLQELVSIMEKALNEKIEKELN